jgi:erythromycin esterase-like protein
MLTANKYFKKISCFFYFTIILVACSSVNDNYYNLDFQRKSINGWPDDWIDELDMGHLYYDSTMNVNGNTPVCIDNENINRGTITIRRFTLNYSLGNFVSLPQSKDVREIEVSVNYKSQNLDKARLQVYVVDKDGKLLNEYSEEMPDTKTWEKIKIHLTDSQAQHLYVSVVTTSNNVINQVSNLVREKNIHPHLDSCWMYFPVQKLWIDKINIKAGELVMADFMPEMMPQPEIKHEDLIPLDLNNKSTFVQIQDLKGKKIIGIGESAHTTKEFPKIAYALIKDRILHHNCKLVILELPFSWGLKLNLFVNKETSFGMKEIEKQLKPMDDLRDFLLWLINYNQTAERKVSIAGMDIELGSFRSNLLSFVNEYIPVDSLLFAPVFLDIFEDKNTEAWDKFFTNRKRFDNILGRHETNMIMYGIRHFVPEYKLGEEKKLLLAERDSLMYNNCQVAIDNLLRDDETAVVYAHLGHTFKNGANNPRYAPAMGAYLSESFGNDYLSVGLLTYSEEMDAANNLQDTKKSRLQTFWDTTMAFEPAPPYSLEAACEKTTIPLFYTSTRGLPSTVMLRSSGVNIFRGRFLYFPVKGMDAFIFVNRVHKKDPEESQPADDKMYWQNRAYELTRKKNKAE